MSSAGRSETPARIDAMTQDGMALMFLRDALKRESTPEHTFTGVLRIFAECSCGSLHPVLDGSNDASSPTPCGTCDRCPECVACHCPTGDHDSPFCTACLNDGDADEWLGRQR